MLKSQFATEEKESQQNQNTQTQFYKTNSNNKKDPKATIISNKTATVSEMMVKIIRCIGLFAIIITPCKRQSE